MMLALTCFIWAKMRLQRGDFNELGAILVTGAFVMSIVAAMFTDLALVEMIRRQ